MPAGELVEPIILLFLRVAMPMDRAHSRRNWSPVPARRRAAERGPVVEAFESRILFHLHVETPIPDVLVSPNSAPGTIDLYQFVFNEESGPTVRLDYGSLGQIDILLLEKQAPLSVANFLKYVNNGAFAGTVIHRSEPGFIIQGGGFKPDGMDISPDGTPTVKNEFSTSRSNVRGTIAYAKLPAFNDLNGNGQQDPGEPTIPGGGPDSATTEWFYNLADNSSNLDNQNGGFTAFGRVVGNGMAVADAIGALPRTDATVKGSAFSAFNHLPVTNTSLPTLPATSSPTASDMVVLNSINVISQPVTYTATSTNTALVNPTVNGKALTLTYGAQQVGTATVTVTATEPGGATVQDTFIVTVGSTPVGVGQGANAQVVNFTDSDGTVASVSIRGGTGTLSFDGQNITQSTVGRAVTVGGTNLKLINIALAGTRPSVNVRTTSGGGDNLVNIGGFTADGPVGGIVGRTVQLGGTSTFSNAIGKLDVGGTQNATITINRSGAAGFTEPSITIGSAVDTDITSQAPLKLRLNSWGGTDGNADTITAPAVRSLTVNGNFTGDLDVSGNGQRVGSPALTNARVAGALGAGTWTVGKASRVSAGSVAADWAGTFADVASFAVAGDLAGDITANSVNSLTAGSITGSNIRLNLAPATKAVGLGRLTSRGAITNSLVRSTASIGTVTAGAINGSSIYAGVTATEGGFLPTAVGDFASASSIRGVTVRNGGTAAGFVNSDIAAATLGRMSLGVVQVDNAGVPFGLAADTVLSLSAIGAGGAPIRTGLLTDAAQSLDVTDFEVRVF
jgi:cyclophilin family peptidyl-prolyl cis-trans isomerase